MKLTPQQRINNTATQMVTGLTDLCHQYRNWLEHGMELSANVAKGYTTLKIEGNQLKKALEENCKKLETVLEYVLDDKSNRITKGQGEVRTRTRGE